MSIIYRNHMSGTLSAELSGAGTTAESSNFANLPVLTGLGSHMWLVLDPEGDEGMPEIVRATVHTSSSTSVTIIRAQQGTSNRVHPEGTKWVNAVTQSDLDELPFRKVTGAGQLLVGTSSSSVAPLSLGAANRMLRVNGAGTGLEWSQVQSANIALNAVNFSHIADGQILGPKITASTWSTNTSFGWVNPGAGGGSPSAERRHRVLGNVVFFAMRLTTGASANTEGFSFELPFPVAASVGTGGFTFTAAVTTSTATYPQAGVIAGGTSPARSFLFVTNRGMPGASGPRLSQSDLVEGDSIRISGCYETDEPPS